MDATAIGQAVGTIAVIIVAAKGAWDSRKARRNSAAVGNGWTAGIDKRFDRLEELLTDHLAAHADSDLKRRR